MTCQSFNCDETRGAGFPPFEIAYTLARPAWGNGYAREGAAAALRFARETLRREEITSIIHPGNAGSIHVAESLGAVAGETVDRVDAIVARTSRSRPAFSHAPCASRPARAGSS